jgi:hypothetical protein
MTRLFLAMSAILVLAACEDTNTGNAWYEEGDATYDKLKLAHDACTGKGGTWQLKPQGDATHMGDYECLTAKKGS